MTTMHPRTVLRAGATVAGAALALSALGGTAYAFWTTSGSGSGAASARPFLAVTVSAGTAPAGQLYPGLVANGSSTGGDLVVNADNPNPFPVTVTVTLSSTSGCTTTGVTIGSPASFTLPATSGTVARTMTKVLSMSTASSSDCQGVTVTVNLTTSAQSS